jgi:Adenylate and Guanylate cyclase catalytic domain
MMLLVGRSVRECYPHVLLIIYSYSGNCRCSTWRQRTVPVVRRRKCPNVAKNVDVDSPRITYISFFWQTVNTAARMESNGAPNRIQCSQETATLLEQAGKSWTRLHPTKVKAKGKGELQTYWLDFRAGADHSTAGSRNSDESSQVAAFDRGNGDKWTEAGLRSQTDKEEKLCDEKINRLVDWNTDVLCRILKQIAGRNRIANKRGSVDVIQAATTRSDEHRSDGTVLDEVVEVIELPELNAHAAVHTDVGNGVVLDPIVVQQLRDYVYRIACMYKSNPFHNFEHVSAMQLA